MASKKKTKQPQRGQYIQAIAYLRPEQLERLRETVARTQVPGARLIRAGIDLILDHPELVQRPPANADAEASR